MAIRVFLADDHYLIREGLHKILSLADDIEVVGEAATGDEALAQVENLQPDVLLLDLNLPGTDGIDVANFLRMRHPEIRVVALTIYDDEHHVLEAVKAGMVGYLLKDIGPDELVAAIRAVARGEAVIQPRVAGRFLQGFAKLARAAGPNNLPHLTEREIEVLRLVAKGYSNKDIAVHLFISQKTVKNHMTNILHKLEITDRTQAAIWAIRHGLI